MNNDKFPKEDPKEFSRTLGKVLITLLLGFAALLALAATACGLLLTKGMGQHGWGVAGVFLIVTGALIYAIICVWR